MSNFTIGIVIIPSSVFTIFVITVIVITIIVINVIVITVCVITVLVITIFVINFIVNYDLNVLPPDIDHQVRILQEIKNISFSGLTGQISFDEHGRRKNFTLDVMEMTVRSEMIQVVSFGLSFHSGSCFNSCSCFCS